MAHSSFSMMHILFPLLLTTISMHNVQGYIGTSNPKMRGQHSLRGIHGIALRSSVLEDVPKSDMTASKTTIELPPLIKSIADERLEFDMNLGKAIDVLRKDYPQMLDTTPDFSIYNDDIYVIDPSGVQLSGLGNYKNSFTFLQSIIRFFYNMEQSSVQNRIMYDFARQSIRISWNVVLVPKVVGNRRNALYVDGISIYKMDKTTGKIGEHRVENMLINDIPVTPPYGVLTSLQKELLYPSGQRVPAGVGIGAMTTFG